MEKLTLTIGLTIFGLLGITHLFYTFLTDKFAPLGIDVKKAMLSSSPRITKQTDMWRAWIGFNASHSLGLISFTVIYLYLSIVHFQLIVSSLVLSTFPVIVSISYLLLAQKYWFKIPFIGIAISLLCFSIFAWLANF